MEKKKLWVMFILVVICFPLLTTDSPAAEETRPNVILMLADNLGYGDASCYNGGIRGGMRTPRIDQLASEGIRFTQFLVEPGCTPSRAGLLTGRYSVRSGLSMIIAPGGINTLQEEEVTLGELFKSVGYNTTYIGKWHLDAEPKSQPQNQGFDQWLVGFSGTTDVVYYPQTMKESGAPEAMRKALEYWIVEAKGPGEPKRIRPYDVEYRKQIEEDIAKASVAYIKQQAAAKKPFFLFVGWTRPHFPNDVGPKFAGKSGVGKYGDSVLELDYRTGEVLDGIKEAGIEDNTIVIWISDNGPTATGGGNDELYFGDVGPFRGELGDAYEGSIRTVGMVRWPGKIKPRVSNEMFAIHDFLPTLATIIGAEVPNDRPIDGVDQSAFLLGEQEHSNREHLLTFVGDRLVAVRWKQWRLYPVEFMGSQGNPSIAGYVGTMRETAGFPQAYNIEADPKEQVSVMHTNGWLIAPYLQLINRYQESLKEHPNPPAPNLTNIR
ncbi:MAG: arylsulfatase [Planctomycetota bacterium]